MRRTDKLETVWPQPPHTKAKHDLLTGYLGAWFGILGNSRWDDKVAVLDPFAGPGVYAAGEPGSPMLALSTLLDHNLFSEWKNTEFLFLFNEADAKRHASLEVELGKFAASRPGGKVPPNVKVHSSNLTFGKVAGDLLDGMPPRQQLVPIFAFIDPFGFSDCSIELIKRLLAYPKAELLIYFDFNNINRFATAGNVDPHLTELFGTDEYKNAPPSGTARHDFLHDLYERQLKKVCSFAHVRSFAMLNEKGHIGNYLFFGTKNLQAFDKMKQSMWRVAPGGDFRFEDRLAGEPVLFEVEPDFMPLRHALQAQFGGRTASIEDVIAWVVAETPYHSGQVKLKTLKPMQEDGLITSPNQKRKNQYPDGTLIAFASGKL